MFGFTSMIARDWILANLGQKLETMQSFFCLGVLAISIAGHALIISIALYNYAKARKMSASWNGEDENVMDAIEKRQNFAMLWSNVLLIFTLLFFALVMSASGIFEVWDGLDKTQTEIHMFNVFAFIGSYPILIAGIVFYFVIYKCVIDLKKKMNPEKQGSVFDFRFERKWENSSDEAEKQAMYKAGYKAFQAANLTCAMVWLLAVIAQIILSAGVLPVVCVCVIWFVLNTTYALAVIRLGKRK